MLSPLNSASCYRLQRALAPSAFADDACSRRGREGRNFVGPGRGAFLGAVTQRLRGAFFSLCCVKLAAWPRAFILKARMSSTFANWRSSCSISWRRCTRCHMSCGCRSRWLRFCTRLAAPSARVHNTSMASTSRATWIFPALRKPTASSSSCLVRYQGDSEPDPEHKLFLSSER